MKEGTAMTFADPPRRFRLAWSIGVLLAMATVAGILSFAMMGTTIVGHSPTATAPKEVSDRSVPDAARAMLREYKPAPLSKSMQQLLSNPDEFHVPSIEHPLIGKAAPSFELGDWRGQKVRLEDELAKGPVVLVFYYGYWCDHCVVQLFDLNEEFAKFEELGATLIAISADSAEVTADKFEQYGPFAFTVLSDPDSQVAKQYDCFDPASDGHEAKQFHGSFVLDPTGIIRWADISDKPFRSTRTLLYEVAKLQGSVPGG